MRAIYNSKIAQIVGFNFIVWPLYVFFKSPLHTLDPKSELYPILIRRRIIKKYGVLTYYLAITTAFFTNCFRDEPLVPFKELETSYYEHFIVTTEEQNLLYGSEFSDV